VSGDVYTVETSVPMGGVSPSRVKYFIVKSRPTGRGAFNCYLHRRPVTYGKWTTHGKHLCACEAEKELRSRTRVGLRDVAVFYNGQRLTEKGRAYFMKDTRDWLRRRDLL
jgi:hypothetical protein